MIRTNCDDRFWLLAGGGGGSVGISLKNEMSAEGGAVSGGGGEISGGRADVAGIKKRPSPSPLSGFTFSFF